MPDAGVCPGETPGRLKKLTLVMVVDSNRSSRRPRPARDFTLNVSAPASAPVARSCTTNTTCCSSALESILASAVIRPGTVAVVTVTTNDPVALLPCASLDEQATVVAPIGNVAPDAGAQATLSVPSTTSLAPAPH